MLTKTILAAAVLAAIALAPHALGTGAMMRNGISLNLTNYMLPVVPTAIARGRWYISEWHSASTALRSTAPNCNGIHDEWQKSERDPA